jgi:hypothetical protein
MVGHIGPGSHVHARLQRAVVLPCFVTVPRASVAKPLDSSTVVTNPKLDVDELDRFSRTSNRRPSSHPLPS